MKILHKHFHFAGVFLIVGLALVPAASADSLPGSGSSADSSPALPPADLGGWFSNGDSEFLFPTPLDPSLPWTSADNLATISAWQSLIGATQGDPALLALLVGMGMNSSSNSQMSSILLSVSGQSVTNGSSLPATDVSGAPEPALLGFLGGGAALLAFLAMASAVGDRARSVKIIGSPCPAMKASSIQL